MINAHFWPFFELFINIVNSHIYTKYNNSKFLRPLFKIILKDRYYLKAEVRGILLLARIRSPFLLVEMNQEFLYYN